MGRGRAQPLRAWNVLKKVAQGAVQVGARTHATPVVDAWAGGVHSPCGRGCCGALAYLCAPGLLTPPLHPCTW